MSILSYDSIRPNKQHRLTFTRTLEHNALADIWQSVEEFKNMVRRARWAGRRIERHLCRSSHHTEPPTTHPSAPSPTQINDPISVPWQHGSETLQGSIPGHPGWPTAGHAGFDNFEIVSDIGSSTYDSTDVESIETATNDGMEDGDADTASNFSWGHETDALSSPGGTEAASVDMETESVNSESTAYPEDAEPDFEDHENDAVSDTTATQASDAEAGPDATAPTDAEEEVPQTLGASPDHDSHSEQPSTQGPFSSSEETRTQPEVLACAHLFEKFVSGYCWSLVVFSSSVIRTKCRSCGAYRTRRRFSSILKEGQDGGAEINWTHIKALEWIPGASGVWVHAE